MARVLDALPPRMHGTNSKYPLNDWFDGRVWELTQDTDFPGTIDNVRSSLSTSANARGLFLATRKISKTTLVIQATPRASSNGSRK